jgi:signal transduction histidine kinase/CheY-like chemotaxis protein
MVLDYAHGHQHVLTLIARGRPMHESLDAVARWVEQNAPGVLCSIMTADDSGTALRVAAAPNLPASFREAVDNLPIGPSGAICGTAAHRREPVIVADTFTDPLTAGFVALAREHSVRAGWSTPIISIDGTLLGTFALYYRVVGEPDTDHRQIVDDATALAQIAIERHHTESALRQAQKMEAVGQLAGGIAHDFNNILAVIKLNASMLTGLLPHGSAGRLEAEEIDRAADRAGLITRQLLAFGRRQPVELRRLHVADIVAESEPLLRRLLGGTIDLDIDIQRNLGAVLGDSGQLGQVLMNLAMNARDAMPAGGSLRITARKIEARDASDSAVGLGNAIQIEVADTGVGIPDDVRDRIFEPFFTTKAAGKGTGLGLSMAYAIVQQSGGQIAVESSQGRETIFRITLPEAADADAKELRATRAETDLPGGSETILVVEDELAVRRATTRTLGRLGYTVIEARHGRDALQLFDANPAGIDLVVSDLVMPEMGGWELVRQLRQRRPDLPLLMISGYDRDASGQQQREPGILFLGKPFTLLALAQHCRAALDGVPPTRVESS